MLPHFHIILKIDILNLRIKFWALHEQKRLFLLQSYFYLIIFYMCNTNAVTILHNNPIVVMSIFEPHCDYLGNRRAVKAH